MLKSVLAFLTRLRLKLWPKFEPPVVDEAALERERQKRRLEEFRKKSPFTYK